MRFIRAVICGIMMGVLLIGSLEFAAPRAFAEEAEQLDMFQDLFELTSPPPEEELQKLECSETTFLPTEQALQRVQELLALQSKSSPWSRKILFRLYRPQIRRFVEAQCRGRGPSCSVPMVMEAIQREQDAAVRNFKSLRGRFYNFGIWIAAAEIAKLMWGDTGAAVVGAGFLMDHFRFFRNNFQAAYEPFINQFSAKLMDPEGVITSVKSNPAWWDQSKIEAARVNSGDVLGKNVFHHNLAELEQRAQTVKLSIIGKAVYANLTPEQKAMPIFQVLNPSDTFIIETELAIYFQWFRVYHPGVRPDNQEVINKIAPLFFQFREVANQRWEGIMQTVKRLDSMELLNARDNHFNFERNLRPFYELIRKTWFDSRYIRY